MDKKKLWILTGGIIIALLIILLLILLPKLIKEEPFVPKTYPTYNGGTIYALSKASESVAFNTDGTSVSDALYEYKSKLGYSLQYNNKYYVDFGTKEYDFKISTKDNSVSATLVVQELTEKIDDPLAGLQTKEDWNNYIGAALGECVNFDKKTINNMDAISAQHIYTSDDGRQLSVIYVIMVGSKNMYAYRCDALSNASEADVASIGNVLFTIKEIQ